MSIQTDLSVSPYFDDYSEQKDFYKILFRPGVAVQARELNQLQTILQKQIERFGDNIFKQGTIISGCDITFHDNLQYVKIKDIETNSQAVDVARYKGYRVRNQNNLTPLEASIIETVPGFEATAPDLNTLYIRYLNTGFVTGGPANGQSRFNASEQLTVYNPDAPLEKITVLNGSSGFVATDKVVILSAIAVQNTSGGTAFANNFVVGEFITDGTANVQIKAIDTTTFSDAVVLKIAPRLADLRAGDSSKWTLSSNTNVQSTSTPASSIARISSIIGSGAQGVITISRLGEITGISMTATGSGYTVLPYVTIQSSNATEGQIGQFQTLPQTHLATITVSSLGAPAGNAYGMTVGEGVIYQKGYFSRVAEQLVIVEKYSNTPDAKSVGFETDEEIINSNQDSSLLDNATGAPNFTAPGANRLKLTPRLSVISKAEADARTDWLYVAEFSNGNPYKQNRQTVYNVIGKYIDSRFNETAGSYSTNPFLVTTKNPLLFTDEPTKFNVFIDPGVAFINGTRVETTLNYEAPVNKGTDTLTVQNGNISLNYGNYVKVNEIGGNFQFKTGDRVLLYDTANRFVSTLKAGTQPSPVGINIGYARIRSIVFDSGVPGTPSAVYRLYLFDVRMNFGNNFADVKSIYYDGTRKAVCDTVLESGKAVIKDNTLSSLIYYAGAPAVVNAAAISYIYRTSFEPSSGLSNLGSGGTITISLGSGSNESFPYTGSLSTTQLRDIIVTPLANGEVSSSLTGAVAASSTSNTVTGTSTLFVSELREGDYIKFSGGGIGQVSQIANDTVLYLSTNATASTTGSETFKIYFPGNVPVSLEREGRGAVVSGDQKQLTITIAGGMFAPIPAAITYNVRESNVTPITKTVNRDKYVRLCLANNAGTSTGPWALGVADVFRLKNVYKGANGTFGTSETNVTQNFYIDHNQTEDYYGHSYLYLRPGAELALTSADWLLVEFDHFTVTQDGLKAPGGSGTYPINDAVTLAAATTTINTVEIPEVFGTRGNYYDLRDQFDLRPYISATSTPAATTGSAPLNPAEPSPATFFSSASDKKFPAPDSELSATISYYVGRTDRVIIDESNQFRVLAGTPGSQEAPQAPDNALSINVLKIPPYPSLPYQLSTQMIDYVDTKIANEKYTTRRLNQYRVTTAQTDIERASLQPRGYTMKDIGKLERRIADLEYYTSLTLTELQAQKRSLPGFDGAERFKFGFFVDSFENYTYSDTSNPAYSATIVDGYLSPLTREINVGMSTVDEDTGILPYVEVPFVSQTRATDGPLVTETVVNLVQVTAVVIQEERNRNNSDTGNVYEEFFYTFSSKEGPVEFYINSRDNNIGVEVAQSSTPDGPWTVTHTSATSSPIENADIAAKGLKVLNGGRKIEHPGSEERKIYPTGTTFGTWVEDHLKMLWNHDPDDGLYVRIRIYKGKKHGGFLQSSKSGTFGYKLYYPTDTSVNQVQTDITTNYSLGYSGIAIPYTYFK